jgi:hypothetical protein
MTEKLRIPIRSLFAPIACRLVQATAAFAANVLLTFNLSSTYGPAAEQSNSSLD